MTVRSGRRRPRWLPFSPWHLVLVALVVPFTVPLLWLVLSSFMTNAQINRFPPTVIPDSLHLEGFRYVLTNALFSRWFLNSSIVSLTVVLGNLVFGVLGGYAFARMRFRGSRVVLALMLGTLVIPFQITMIPTFLIMKHLGLINSLGALIVPSLITPFAIFLFRQFFLSLPREIEESAWIDGCSRLRTLWSIVVPMARPALGTVAALTFLGSWNDLAWPLIAINSDSNYTLPLGLATFQGQHRTQWSAVMAGNLIATLPVLIAFLAAQRTFIQSLTSSAIKG